MTDTTDSETTESSGGDRASERPETTRTEAERTETERSEREQSERRGGRRDIEVPMRLYKTVTVFSTLIAVVSVVLGFVLLDAATLQVSLLRRFVTGLLGVVGVAPAQGTLSAALAGLGLATIGFGAGVYVIGTRFRAQGMGKSQEDSGEDSDNG